MHVSSNFPCLMIALAFELPTKERRETVLAGLLQTKLRSNYPQGKNQYVLKTTKEQNKTKKTRLKTRAIQFSFSH